MRAGRAAWTVQTYPRVRTRALRVPSPGGGHGARVRPDAVRENLFCYVKVMVASGAGIRVGAGAGMGTGCRLRRLDEFFIVNYLITLRTRCTTHAACAARVCYE